MHKSNRNLLENFIFFFYSVHRTIFLIHFLFLFFSSYSQHLTPTIALAFINATLTSHSSLHPLFSPSLPFLFHSPLPPSSFLLPSLLSVSSLYPSTSSPLLFPFIPLLFQPSSFPLSSSLSSPSPPPSPLSSPLPSRLLED